MSPAPSRVGRRLLVAGGVLAAGVLVVGTAVVVPRPFGSGVRTVAPAGVAAPLPGAATSPEQRLALVQQVLDRRGAAVRRDDATAYAGTQVARAKAPLFARLKVLPLVRWAYTPSSPTTSTADLVVLPVRLTTRLAGETADATSYETITLRRTGSRWLVVSEVTRGDRAALWDLGTLRVVRGARSLVIGIDAPASTLRAYAATSDRVVPQVTAVWGKAWSRYAVVIVPRTVSQLARALGRTATSLDGYAAVTTAEGVPDATHHVAERVWVNTPAMAGLSSIGRQVVMRHEMTHVATYAPEHPDAPLWLVEGVAEWMGYRGSGIPLDVATGDLLDDVRRGRVPQPLPADAAFAGDGVDVAYESAHLACALVVSRHDASTLVALYRAVAIDGDDVATAYEAVTGDPLSALEDAWRDRARRLA